MQCRVDHPTQPKTYATYGWDKHIQFFIVIQKAGRVVGTYDCITPGYAHLAGALQLLAEHGFFEPWQLELALQRLPHMDEVSDLDPELRLAGEVLINFRLAAA